MFDELFKNIMIVVLFNKNYEQSFRWNECYMYELIEYYVYL